MKYARTKKATYPKRRTGAPRKTKRSYRSKGTNLAPRNVRSYRGTVQRGQLPFGRTFSARLPYVENFAISCDGTVGQTSGTFTMRLNSIYDPRFELGGHQPMQFDILSVAYERVWVHGAKVELTFSNPEYDGMWCGYRVRASTNTLGSYARTIDYIQEMRDCKFVPINNTGRQSKKFVFYVSNRAAFGVTKAQYSNTEYSHTMSSNPPSEVLLEPFALHTISGQTSTIRCNIRVTYYCQFTNPITQAQS